jgi:hypothetical protein
MRPITTPDRASSVRKDTVASTEEEDERADDGVEEQRRKPRAPVPREHVRTDAQEDAPRPVGSGCLGRRLQAPARGVGVEPRPRRGAARPDRRLLPPDRGKRVFGKMDERKFGMGPGSRSGGSPTSLEVRGWRFPGSLVGRPHFKSLAAEPIGGEDHVPAMRRPMASRRSGSSPRRPALRGRRRPLPWRGLTVGSGRLRASRAGPRRRQAARPRRGEERAGASSTRLRDGAARRVDVIG